MVSAHDLWTPYNHAPLYYCSQFLKLIKDQDTILSILHSYFRLAPNKAAACIDLWSQICAYLFKIFNWHTGNATIQAETLGTI